MLTAPDIEHSSRGQDSDKQESSEIDLWRLTAADIQPGVTITGFNELHDFNRLLGFVMGSIQPLVRERYQQNGELMSSESLSKQIKQDEDEIRRRSKFNGRFINYIAEIVEPDLSI